MDDDGGLGTAGILGAVLGDVDDADCSRNAHRDSGRKCAGEEVHNSDVQQREGRVAHA